MMRLVRVVVASSLATAVDVAVLAAMFYAYGRTAGTAALCGSLAGGAVNFLLNRRWVFDATGDAWWRQAALYALVVVGGGAIASAGVVAALHALGLPLLVAKGGAIGVVLVAWTYPMSARVVFRAAGRRPRGAGGRPQLVAETG